MPRFHHSVAVLPLPLQVRTEMLETSFRIGLHRNEVIRTLIGCPPTAERQKIGFNPICHGTELRHNGRWKRQRRNGLFHVRNLRNGNGERATAERQRNGGNQALVLSIGGVAPAVIRPYPRLPTITLEYHN